MNPTTQEELSNKRCAPCEGGVPALSREEAAGAGPERRGLGHRRRRQTDLAVVDRQELHGGNRLLQQGGRTGRRRGASPRPPSRGLSPGHDRPVDPRRRRSHRKRFHPRRQDQPGAGSSASLKSAGLAVRHDRAMIADALGWTSCGLKKAVDRLSEELQERTSRRDGH